MERGGCVVDLRGWSKIVANSPAYFVDAPLFAVRERVVLWRSGPARFLRGGEC
jgi:hypothetical protein